MSKFLLKIIVCLSILATSYFYLQPSSFAFDMVTTSDISKHYGYSARIIREKLKDNNTIYEVELNRTDTIVRPELPTYQIKYEAFVTVTQNNNTDKITWGPIYNWNWVSTERLD